MSRLRTVKPEFWTSEQVTSLSLIARLMFIGLLNFCDDYGVHPDSPAKLRLLVFPGDAQVTTGMVAGYLDEMVAAGLVGRFCHDGRDWLWVTGFKRHQKVDKPSHSNYPRPPLPDGSPTTRGVKEESLPTPSPPLPDGSPTTRGVKEESLPTPSPPLPDGSPTTRGVPAQEWKGMEGLTTTTAREDFGKTDPPPELDPEPPAGPWWEFCDRSLFRDTMEAIRKVPVWQNVPVGDLPDESALRTVWERFESKTAGSEDDFRYEVFKFTESSKRIKVRFNPPSALTTLSNWLDKAFVPAQPPPGGNGKPWQRSRKMGAVELGEAAKAMIAEMDANGETEFDLSRVSGFDLREVIGR